MTSRTLTPVKVTRRPGLSGCRPVPTEAVSLDGFWIYARTGRREWEIRAAGHKSFALAPSLTGARRMTADGSALRIMHRQDAELAATLAAAKAGA